MLAAHIVLTEIKLKFFDWTDLTTNYEYTIHTYSDMKT